MVDWPLRPFMESKDLQPEKWMRLPLLLRQKDSGGLQLSDGELRETQMTNYFSNLYPIDCAVLSVNAQSYRKYGTLPEHEFLPEI